VQCEQPPPPPPTPPDPAPSNAAGWVLLVVVLIVIVFDVWALWSKRLRISQWIRRKAGRRRWWRWPFVAMFVGLLWHVFFGGPL
jgi:threonine/homoserine/homoserine lactone efflux protein